MTFKDKYKRDNENIKVSEETLIKLSERIRNNNIKRKFDYRLMYGAVAVLLIFSVMIINKARLNGENKLVNNEEMVNNTDEDKSLKEVVEVPKLQIAKNNQDFLASRVSTLIYEGKVYLESGSKLTLEEGKALIDKKLGVTESLFHYIEDDGTSAGYVDLESLKGLVGDVEGDEVYTVKGYDESFRLITYKNNGEEEHLELWECLNGMILSSGEDVFGLMKIKGNINTVTWDTFNNWSNGTYNPKELAIDKIIDEFIDGAQKSIPFSLEDKEFRNQFFYDEIQYYAEGEEKQKFLYFKLKDGIEINIRLFSNGYISYSSLPGYVFKVEDNKFNNMWDYLK